MNAEDIIKALRCCYRDVDAYSCAGCPLEILDYPCNEYNLELKAADIIESLQAQLAESQRRERAAVEDLTYFAGAITTGEPCGRCVHNPNDMGCELDGLQFDDDGECHFAWRGPVED